MAEVMTTSPRVPALQNGDRLTRDEFERRYAAMPHVKKAELIDGVVYVGSPVRHGHHGRPDHLLQAWLGYYEMVTPGLDASSNATVRLDLVSEPQPDLLLRLPEHAGGRSRRTADDYLEGPPELAIEVAANSASYDLHQKLHAYLRNGVREYLVYRTEDRAVDWFVLEGSQYIRQQPDARGCLASRLFPGLVLDVPALLRDDLVALRAAIDAATGTTAQAAHAAFVQRLATRG
jgi:Uma2 family endonuclease